MTAIREAIDLAGGPAKAAEACSVSVRAVHKWLSAGALPRTEYSGETTHAENLSTAANGKFTAQWLRENARPVKSASNEEAA